MSAAFCISASSCADLIIRQPRTTGAPGADLDSGHGAPQAVDGEEAHRLLDPDRPGRPGGRAGCRRPRRADPHARSRRAPRPATFRLSRTDGSSKCGVTIAGSPSRGQDRRGQPLAAPPLHAGEIGHRGAGLDQQRAEAVLAPSAAAPWRSAPDIRRGRSARRRRSSGGARPGSCASRRAGRASTAAAPLIARKCRRLVCMARELDRRPRLGKYALS